MKFSIITIFPEAFSYLNESILGKAQEKNLIEIEIFNLRDFSKDKHKKVDDTPYGGGHGMVMTCQPFFDCVKFIKEKSQYKRQYVIYPSPRGEVLTQKKLENFANYEDTEFIILAGRYEGIDQRVIDALVDEEICIGEYVLTGGEIPAMILIDGISRILPGVIGKEKSHLEESFSDAFDGKKEYPLYTKPEVFEGLSVPEVLFSGHHKKIEEWKKNNLK
ncbi:tRNA (guanosine(37)-N1)-methyltransferase TrmD [Candidatus Gracilibacteria bacterium]|nr:tRNA (guanosine(37)-N1)-methyltransferase TrmD [Candidatus Gracilibacteria bacterium]